MPLMSSPGRATSRANRLMRRSYKRRTLFFGGLRAPGLGIPRGLEPIFLHTPVERAAAQPESLRSLTHVSLRALQRFADQNGLHGFQAELFQILTLRAQHVQSEVSALNLIAAAHQDRAFQCVLELANITWPRILHEQLQSGRFEPLNRTPV